MRFIIQGSCGLPSKLPVFCNNRRVPVREQMRMLKIGKPSVRVHAPKQTPFLSSAQVNPVDLALPNQPLRFNSETPCGHSLEKKISNTRKNGASCLSSSSRGGLFRCGSLLWCSLLCRSRCRLCCFGDSAGFGLCQSVLGFLSL